MTQIDLEAFKRVNDAKLMRQNNSAPPQLAALLKKHQQDIANILRNSALKLGLPVDELDVLLKDQQTERRQLVAALRAAKRDPRTLQQHRQRGGCHHLQNGTRGEFFNEAIPLQFPF